MAGQPVWVAKRSWRRCPSRLSPTHHPGDCHNSSLRRCSTRRCRPVAPNWTGSRTSGLLCCRHPRTTLDRRVSSPSALKHTKNKCRVYPSDRLYLSLRVCSRSDYMSKLWTSVLWDQCRSELALFDSCRRQCCYPIRLLRDFCSLLVLPPEEIL